MYLKKDPETSTHELYHDLQRLEPFYASDLKFDFAFTIFNYQWVGGKLVFKNIGNQIDPSILSAYAFSMHSDVEKGILDFLPL